MISHIFVLSRRSGLRVVGPLCLCLLMTACGGGGGISAAEPVVFVDGTERFSDAIGQTAPDLTVSSQSRDPKFGTPTPGTVPDPAFYETGEYHGGGALAPLAVTKFSDAYARGWTGLGSLVTIADTGVDPTHPDLAPALAHTRDYTGTTVADGHGTRDACRRHRRRAARRHRHAWRCVRCAACRGEGGHRLEL